MMFDECVGSKFHSPTPLVVREVKLEDGTIVTLCALCADNLKVYMAEQKESDWKLPWERRREFGNRIRVMANKAHAAKTTKAKT